MHISQNIYFELYQSGTESTDLRAFSLLMMAMIYALKPFSGTSEETQHELLNQCGYPSHTNQFHAYVSVCINPPTLSLGSLSLSLSLDLFNHPYMVSRGILCWSLEETTLHMYTLSTFQWLIACTRLQEKDSGVSLGWNWGPHSGTQKQNSTIETHPNVISSWFLVMHTCRWMRLLEHESSCLRTGSSFGKGYATRFFHLSWTCLY